MMSFRNNGSPPVNVSQKGEKLSLSKNVLYSLSVSSFSFFLSCHIVQVLHDKLQLLVREKVKLNGVEQLVLENLER